MLDRFSRTRLLLGDEGMERLDRARVAVRFTGLAADFAAEALARSGIGAIDIYGGSESITARLSDINPELEINRFTIETEPNTEYDSIIDTADAAKGSLPHEQMANGLIAAGDAVRRLAGR